MIRRAKNSLTRCLWWVDDCSWIARNVSLCPRQIPCVRSQALVAAQHRSRTWNDCRLAGNVRKFSTANRFYILKFSWIIHLIHPFLQFLYLWSEVLSRCRNLSPFLQREFINSHFLRSLQLFHFMDISDTTISKNSSTRISWGLFNSSISWIFRIRLSRSAFCRRANSSCTRAFSLRDSSYPQFALSHSNRWQWACRCDSRMQVLRATTLHFCFRISDFASASMWSLWPSRSDLTEFSGWENLSNGSLFPKTCWCPEEKSSLSENVSWFDLYCFKTTQRVSPYSSDLEMHLTSSFLLQSDKLPIGPHLLLAPASTVLKPAQHEVAHRLSPIPVAPGLYSWSLTAIGTPRNSVPYWTSTRTAVTISRRDAHLHPVHPTFGTVLARERLF